MESKMNQEKRSRYSRADKAVFILIGLTMTTIIVQAVALFLYPY